MTGYFLQAFIYLAAAVIAVPIAKRCGLGSVLGYLLAGVAIGPLFGLVGDETETIKHFAEFGVVMMLFLVGLELEPKTLWAMKTRLMGLGGLQVGLTIAATTLIALWLDFSWQLSVAIGFILALSSTAIVLQTLQEKGLQQNEGGRGAFSVLLFQDIAVLPMLAVIPLLAAPELVAQSAGASEAQGHGAAQGFVAGLPGWAYGLTVIGAIALVVVGGHYLSRPLFRFVAASGIREIFTATALMLVIGIAALMSIVGLSPALGTFLAGVVLANSEFRHELHSNVDPFKGLLLGLFFITVGAGINVSVLNEYMVIVLSLTVAVIVVKAIIIFAIARLFSIQGSDRWLLTLSLAQAGEFGFVLISYATQNNVLPEPVAQVLLLVVALSMFLTPGLFILFDKLIWPAYVKKTNRRQPDTVNKKAPVVIAGIGRFGQIVNRLLVASKVPTVVLDVRSEQVEAMRRINTEAYFGDASKPDILATAGVEQACMMIVAIDNRQQAIDMVKYVRKQFPDVYVLARAFDRGHGYRLRHAGAHYTVTETYHSALQLSAGALTRYGYDEDQVARHISLYEKTEAQQSDKLYEAWLDDTSGVRVDNNYLKLFMQLETLFNEAINKQTSDDTRQSADRDNET